MSRGKFPSDRNRATLSTVSCMESPGWIDKVPAPEEKANNRRGRVGFADPRSKWTPFSRVRFPTSARRRGSINASSRHVRLSLLSSASLRRAKRAKSTGGRNASSSRSCFEKASRLMIAFYTRRYNALREIGNSATIHLVMARGYFSARVFSFFAKLELLWGRKKKDF